MTSASDGTPKEYHSDLLTSGLNAHSDRCSSYRPGISLHRVICLVQVRGEQAVVLNTGDVVFAPDGEEHWHGASPDHFMTHLSITEGAPQWPSHVTDEEYQSGPQ